MNPDWDQRWEIIQSWNSVDLIGLGTLQCQFKSYLWLHLYFLNRFQSFNMTATVPSSHAVKSHELPSSIKKSTPFVHRRERMRIRIEMICWYNFFYNISGKYENEAKLCYHSILSTKGDIILKLWKFGIYFQKAVNEIRFVLRI